MKSITGSYYIFAISCFVVLWTKVKKCFNAQNKSLIIFDYKVKSVRIDLSLGSSPHQFSVSMHDNSYQTARHIGTVWAKASKTKKKKSLYLNACNNQINGHFFAIYLRSHFLLRSKKLFSVPCSIDLQIKFFWSWA